MRTHRPLNQLMGDALDALKRRHLFNPSFVDSVRDVFANGHSSYHGGVVWELMMLELWLRADAATARIS
jgi:asparagine synthase (glutamine-hydrolysing)